MKNLSALVGFSLLTLGRPCIASQDYPPVFTAQWHLARDPACTICHTTDLGGTGTATKLFARSLQQQGLGASDPSLLASLLEQTKLCQTDSDGDGVSDFVEISNATSGTGDSQFADPNDGTGAPTSLCGDVYDGPIPRTGCAVRPSASPDSHGWLSAVALLGLLSARRKRRRPNPSASTAARKNRPSERARPLTFAGE
jgi:MYXO-CTERM domain-containing protein